MKIQFFPCGFWTYFQKEIVIKAGCMACHIYLCSVPCLEPCGAVLCAYTIKFHPPYMIMECKLVKSSLESRVCFVKYAETLQTNHLNTVLSGCGGTVMD